MAVNWKKGRVLHEGRWVTKCWLARHGAGASQKKPRKPYDEFSPENIEFARDILVAIDRFTNPMFKDRIVRMLDELRRIKSQSPTP